MNLRPAILSAPFPWLIIITAKLFGKEPKGANKNKKLFTLPRTLSFTYEGKRYIAILILIGFAAINTGNNLLYLIVAMLLSIIIISGILSESTLRGVFIERHALGAIYKDSPTKINYSIKNTKKKIPSYSINLIEINQENLLGNGSYILKIDSQSKKNLQVEYTFLKRGLYQLEGLSISTRFPFGLFIKTKKNYIATEVLVYPAIKPLEIKTLNNGSSLGVKESNEKGFGGDLYGARKHRPEDDSRHIDWKSSAKSGTLMHKEFTRDSDKEIIIKFSNYSNEKDIDDGFSNFEDLVDEAASLIKHFLDKGYSVGLTTLNTKIAPNRGPKHESIIFKELALIKPVYSSSLMSNIAIEGAK